MSRDWGKQPPKKEGSPLAIALKMIGRVRESAARIGSESDESRLFSASNDQGTLVSRRPSPATYSILEIFRVTVVYSSPSGVCAKKCHMPVA